jgi:hypothetical protein
MKKNLLICFALSFIFLSGNAQQRQPKIVSHQEAPVIKFTENKGQWNGNVLFKAHLDGGSLFLEKNCFTYNFYEKEKMRGLHASAEALSIGERRVMEHSFRVTLKNSLVPEAIEALHKSSNYSNFFIGNNPGRWASMVYDYSTVYYKNIYPGIDLEVNGKENSLKYNFIVHPGADAQNICLRYDGITGIKEERGSLKITTPLTTIIEETPYAYQDENGRQKAVGCHFILKGSELRFSVDENYNPALPLVIDPLLVFCSYSGSLADNFGMTATYDNQGNFYAGGTVFDQGYPTTIGAYDTTYNGPVQAGRTDIVITKYNSTGSNLIYSTYIGGASGTEIVSSIIVNANNELMLLGATGSTDFPVSATAFDNSFNGGTYLNYASNGTEYANGTDLYLAKLSADGSQLLASTLVGGSANDGVNSSPSLAYNYGDFYRGEIQTDAAGNFYAASCTYSSDFPATGGAFQTVPGGQLDGCVLKMSPDLSTMLWCSYLGGLTDDCAYSLIQDDSLNVYVDGGTASSNFPTTAGTIGPNYFGGITDGFVTKIKFDGSAILRSSFIGTSLYDQSYFIQKDTSDNIYLYGQSLGNFPVSANVYSNPNSKQFIAVINNNLSVINHSTVFGNGNGNINISPCAFLVDQCGNIYCSGWGGSIIAPITTTFNMPVTFDALQPTTDGHNFYFIVFTPLLQSLAYASYFGGGVSQEHVDGGTSRFDPEGVIYQSVCAGCGGNSDLPTTVGAWSNTNNSTNCNNGTIKLDFQVFEKTCVPLGTNEEQAKENNIFLSPSPAINQFTIYGLKGTNSEIEMYNILGDMIFSQKPKAGSQRQITVDISNLPGGIYFVRIAGENEHAVRKVVIQH